MLSGRKRPSVSSYLTMPTKLRTYEKRGTSADGSTYSQEVYRNRSNWTLKSNGKPDLSVQNEHEFIRNRTVYFRRTFVDNPFNPGDLRAWTPLSASSSSQFLPPNFDWGPLNNEAYAKFNGKLRYGSASLGVTAASWKQSRDMIVKRSGDVQRTLDSTIQRLSRDRRGRKRLSKEKEPLANQILEGEFGWAPLFQDMKAALGSVCKEAIPPEWCTGRAKRTVYHEEFESSGNPKARRSWDGRAMLTYTAAVKINNDNLWLANRLGLINPATVLWDLVPWSFVVNMFLNVNQIVNSVTDTVGLDITGQSITATTQIGVEELLYSDATSTYPLGYPGPGQSRINSKTKTRTLGSRPPLSWQAKVPELNWELAVIATSLVVQRFKKVNDLIRVL